MELALFFEGKIQLFSIYFSAKNKNYSKFLLINIIRRRRNQFVYSIPLLVEIVKAN